MITNPYIQDKNKCMTPVYVPGEGYAFYLNFDNPVNDPDFANFKLNIIKNGVIFDSNIGVLQKHVVKGVNLYNIYCNFIFPDIPEGQYQFSIYDSVKNVEKCRSNVVICVRNNFDLIAQKLVYFDDDNIFNYYYELLPSFKNRFRLPIAKVDYQFETNRVQYRNISDNKLRNLKSYRDIIFKIESYYFDEAAHTAMSCVYEHENIFISNEGITPKGAYTIETSQIAATTKGTVDAYINGDELETFFEGFDTIIDAGHVGEFRDIIIKTKTP